MIEKAHKVEELEKEISHTIEGQIRENQELRGKLADNSLLLQAYREAETVVKANLPQRAQTGHLPTLISLLMDQTARRQQEQVAHLESQINRLKLDYEVKEKQLMTKVLRLREDRSRLRSSQSMLNAHLDEINQIIS